MLHALSGPTRERAVPVAIVIGELDVSCGPWLTDALLGELGDGCALVLDTGGITFVDSSILVVLMHIQRICRERGGQLILARPNPPINRILQVTGLGSILRVEAEVDHALAVLGARRKFRLVTLEAELGRPPKATVPKRVRRLSGVP